MFTTSSEKVVRSDILANIYNPELFNEKRELIVDLECGHKAIARISRRSIRCSRCMEMLRRSMADGGEDWEAFRYRGGRDTMRWPEDRCRTFNEPTNLAGEFLND